MTDDRVWKRRFFLLSLVRLSGALLIMLGLVMAFSDKIVRGGNELSGICIALAGLIDLVLFPAILRQRWRQP